MPRRRLQQALDALHKQLDATEELGEQDRAALVETMEEIRDALARGEEEPLVTEGALGRRVYAMIDDFDNSHPKFAQLLRNLSESLANLGI